MSDEHTEDSIARELAAYQERLEREDAAYSRASFGVAESDSELDLADLKRCLDLLHKLSPRLHATEKPAYGMELDSAARPAERFQRLDELGSGGFGVVWRARDPVTGRIVALKMPRPEVLASPELRKRFEQEAEAAARLDHPNIVPILEAGADGIVPYIASVYYEGPTLAQWLAKHNGAVPPRQAALIALQLAKALTHAHERGVLHRDVKPSNVLLAPLDDSEQRELPFEPKLMDFGLAKLGERDQELTRTGAMLGTLKYMAPEQAAGRAKEITAATDVYGLGVVLYEMLAGKPPFSAESDWLTLRQVLEDEPRSVSSIRRDVPRDLAVIVQKCLFKAPAGRYCNARELADDLDCFLTGKAIVARPVSTVERLAKWCRRKPSLAALCAVVVLSVFSGIAFLSYSNMRISSALEAEKVTREELSARLYAADMRRADEALRQKDVGHAREILNRYTNASGDKDVREFAWHFLSQRLPQQQAFTPTHPGPVYSIDLSPDEKLLATACADGRVRIWNRGKLVHEIECDSAEPNEVAFSPDGKWLAAACDDGLVRVWRTGDWGLHKSLPIGGVITTDFAGKSDQIQAVALQENGSILAVGARAWGKNDFDAAIARYKPDGTIDQNFGPGGDVLVWGSVNSDEGYSVLVEPNGKIVAAGHQGRSDFAVVRLNPDGHFDSTFGKSGKVILDLGTDRDRAFSLVRQSDGNYLLGGHIWSNGTYDSAVVRLLPNGSLDHSWGVGGVQVTDTSRTFEAVLSLALQPDGKTLAAGYSQQSDTPTKATSCLILRFNPNGTLDSTFGDDGVLLPKLWGDSQTAQAVVIQPDGKILVAGLAARDDSKRGIVVRLTRDGDLDASFGSEGVALMDYGFQSLALHAMVLQPDGKILVAGVAENGQASAMLTARLNADGSTDSKFGLDGCSLARAGNAAEAFALALQPDGKIVTGGNARCGSRSTAGRNFALTRLMPDGRPDLSFGSNGAQGVRFTPDSSQVVAYAEQCIRFWDVATGEMSKETYIPQANIESLDISQDGSQLAVAGPSNVWTWNVNELDVTSTRWYSLQGISSVAFLPDSRQAAVGLDSSELQLLDVAANEIVRPLAVDGPLRRRMVSRSADGRWLKSWSANTATVYRTDDLVQVADLAMQGRVFDVQIGPGGESVLASTVTGDVVTWPLDSSQPCALGMAGRMVYSAAAQDQLYLAFAADCKSIACAHGDGTVRLLDADSGKIRFETNTTTRGEVMGVGFLESNRIVVGYSSGVIATVTIGKEEESEIRNFEHPIQRLAVSPDGLQIAVSRDDSQTVDVLRGSDQRRICRIDHHGSGRFLGFSRAADHIIINGGGHLEVFDTVTGKRVAGKSKPGDIYDAISLFPNQDLMAVTEGVHGITVREISTCRVVGKLLSGMQNMKWVAVSSDGRNLATAGSDNAIRIWDTNTYEPVLTLDDTPAERIYFIGHKLYVQRTKSLLVWEAE